MNQALKIFFSQGAPTAYVLIAVALGLLFAGLIVKGRIDSWLSKRQEREQLELAREANDLAAKSNTNEHLRNRTDAEREEGIKNRENPDYISSDLLR